MFKDDYKKANEELKIDPELYSKISSDIKAPAKEAPKIKKFPISKLVAAVAGICIIIGVAFASPFILPNKAGLKEENKSSAISTPPLTTSIKEETASDVEIIEEAPPLEEESEAKPVSSQETQSKQPNSSPQNPNREDDFDPNAWRKLVDPKYEDVFEAFSNSYNLSINNNITSANKGTYYEWSDDAWSDDLSLEEDMSIDDSAEPESSGSSNDFSGTNNQVDGVDEADIVKTDGKYIYRLVSSIKPTIKIFNASGSKTTEISETKLSFPKADVEVIPHNMFLQNDKLIIIANPDFSYSYDAAAGIFTYDVSNPRAPELVNYQYQKGRIVSSRLYDGVLYLATYQETFYNVDPAKKKTYLPYQKSEKGLKYFKRDEIVIQNKSESYLIACSYSAETGNQIDRVATLGGGDEMYMNKNYLLCANSTNRKTFLNLFKFEKGKIESLASKKIKGTLLNQFSMDIYKNHVRLVLTVYDEDYDSTNSLVILNKKLKKTGEIKGLAKNERIYSARFMGDTGYFVTFRETDPLYCADLSDPKNPKILSALKIPGFSSYLHPYGDGLLLGLGCTDSGADILKLSMFDISNPKSIKEITSKRVSSKDAYYSGSEALSNHKAFFANVQKNLFGFSFYEEDDDDDYYYSRIYRLYKYTDSGFEIVTNIILNETERSIRGLYVGDYFYISTDKRLLIYDMKTWEEVATIK